MFYETSLDKPQKDDIFTVAEDLEGYLLLLPKSFNLPGPDRDSFFQSFRNCLGLLHDLIIGVYPHLLINQGMEIEIIPEDEEE